MSDNSRAIVTSASEPNVDQSSMSGNISSNVLLVDNLTSEHNDSAASSCSSSSSPEVDQHLRKSAMRQEKLKKLSSNEFENALDRNDASSTRDELESLSDGEQNMSNDGNAFNKERPQYDRDALLMIRETTSICGDVQLSREKVSKLCDSILLDSESVLKKSKTKYSFSRDGSVSEKKKTDADRNNPSTSSSPMNDGKSHEIVSKKFSNDPLGRLRLEDQDTFVLSPQRRSFGTGCHGLQGSNSSNNRPNSPPENIRSSSHRAMEPRRIGSGRILRRDDNLEHPPPPPLAGVNSGFRRSGDDWRSKDYNKYSPSSSSVASNPLEGMGRKDFFSESNSNYPSQPRRNNYNSSYSNTSSNNRNNDTYPRNNFYSSSSGNRNKDYAEQEEDVPEWFKEGPTSQTDCIELVGFDEPQTDRNVPQDPTDAQPQPSPRVAASPVPHPMVPSEMPSVEANASEIPPQNSEMTRSDISTNFGNTTLDFNVEDFLEDIIGQDVKERPTPAGNSRLQQFLSVHRDPSPTENMMNTHFSSLARDLKLEGERFMNKMPKENPNPNMFFEPIHSTSDEEYIKRLRQHSVENANLPDALIAAAIRKSKTDFNDQYEKANIQNVHLHNSNLQNEHIRNLSLQHPFLQNSQNIQNTQLKNIQLAAAIQQHQAATANINNRQHPQMPFPQGITTPQIHHQFHQKSASQFPHPMGAQFPQNTLYGASPLPPTYNQPPPTSLPQRKSVQDLMSSGCQSVAELEAGLQKAELESSMNRKLMKKPDVPTNSQEVPSSGQPQGKSAKNQFTDFNDFLKQVRPPPSSDQSSDVFAKLFPSGAKPQRQPMLPNAPTESDVINMMLKSNSEGGPQSKAPPPNRNVQYAPPPQQTSPRPDTTMMPPRHFLQQALGPQPNPAHLHPPIDPIKQLLGGTTSPHHIPHHFMPPPAQQLIPPQIVQSGFMQPDMQMMMHRVQNGQMNEFQFMAQNPNMTVGPREMFTGPPPQMMHRTPSPTPMKHRKRDSERGKSPNAPIHHPHPLANSMQDHRLAKAGSPLAFTPTSVMRNMTHDKAADKSAQEVSQCPPPAHLSAMRPGKRVDYRPEGPFYGNLQKMGNPPPHMQQKVLSVQELESLHHP